MRRHLTHWRRITARLQVLMNSGTGASVLASEAYALSRQCERMAQQFTAAGAVAAKPSTVPHRQQRGPQT